MITGVVLAGGRSRRMGADKALLRLGNETLLERACALLAGPCDEVLVAGRASLPPSLGWVRAALDTFPGEGPLAGMITGLSAARHDTVLVCACDLPLLQPAVLALLIAASPTYNAVLPVVDDRPQPLCALYRRAVLPALTAQFAAGERSPTNALAGLNVRRLREDEVRAADPDLGSFRNVNTPEDWADIQR